MFKSRRRKGRRVSKKTSIEDSSSNVIKEDKFELLNVEDFDEVPESTEEDDRKLAEHILERLRLKKKIPLKDDKTLSTPLPSDASQSLQNPSYSSEELIRLRNAQLKKQMPSFLPSTPSSDKNEFGGINVQEFEQMDVEHGQLISRFKDTNDGVIDLSNDHEITLTDVFSESIGVTIEEMDEFERQQILKGGHGRPDLLRNFPPTSSDPSEITDIFDNTLSTKKIFDLARFEDLSFDDVFLGVELSLSTCNHSILLLSQELDEQSLQLESCKLHLDSSILQSKTTSNIVSVLEAVGTNLESLLRFLTEKMGLVDEARKELEGILESYGREQFLFLSNNIEHIISNSTNSQENSTRDEKCLISYKKKIDSFRYDAQYIMSDSIDDFKDIRFSIELFTNFRAAVPEEFKQCFGYLSLGRIAEFYLGLEMLFWDCLDFLDFVKSLESSKCLDQLKTCHLMNLQEQDNVDFESRIHSGIFHLIHHRILLSIQSSFEPLRIKHMQAVIQVYQQFYDSGITISTESERGQLVAAIQSCFHKTSSVLMSISTVPWSDPLCALKFQQSCSIWKNVLHCISLDGSFWQSHDLVFSKLILPVVLQTPSQRELAKNLVEKYLPSRPWPEKSPLCLLFPCQNKEDDT